MKKEKAKQLAEAFFAYAHTREELGAEGNSGEFHDPKLEEQIIEELKIHFERLSVIFEEIAGYSIHKDEEGDIFFDDELLFDADNALYNF